MFEKYFLPEDKEKALNELACVADCLQLTMLYMANGDFNNANHHIENVSRSLKVLEELKAKKVQREMDIEDALVELSDLGVDVHYMKMG